MLVSSRCHLRTQGRVVVEYCFLTSCKFAFKYNYTVIQTLHVRSLAITKMFYVCIPIQFVAECLILLVGTVWARDLLPSDEYDSVQDQSLQPDFSEYCINKLYREI